MFFKKTENIFVIIILNVFATSRIFLLRNRFFYVDKNTRLEP